MSSICPGRTPFFGVKKGFCIDKSQQEAVAAASSLQDRVQASRDPLLPTHLSPENYSKDVHDSGLKALSDYEKTVFSPVKRRKVCQESQLDKKLVVSMQSLEDKTQLDFNDDLGSKKDINHTIKVKKCGQVLNPLADRRVVHAYIFNIPDLMDIWAEDENHMIGLDPKLLRPTSKEPAYWKCDGGQQNPHIYKASIHNKFASIRRGLKEKGCLICIRNRGAKRIDQHLHLEKEWGSKNIGLQFTSAKVTRSYYWKCLKNEDHSEWSSVLRNRLNGGGRCPECPKLKKNPLSN